MNLNQKLIKEHKDRCRLAFSDIVHFMDSIFGDELRAVNEDEKFIMQFLKTTWTPQKVGWSQMLNMARVPEYIDKYCEAEYYGMLTEKIRKYKLKRRLDKHS